MAGAKEIKTKIKSVNSTKKITKAMEMVSASKMRKTQDAMLGARPYSDVIKYIASHLAETNPEYKHPYMEKRAVKRVGYIIISSDRGLCGGLNINLFKKVLASMEQYSKQGIETECFLIGSKAEGFFKRVKTKIVASVSHLGDKPKSYDFVGGVKVMLAAYDQCQIDELVICYNNFINTVTLVPTLQQVLPILPMGDLFHTHQWDYIYEPDPRQLLELLLVRFIESQVYHAVVENIASEQAARMVAMKSASDNASEVIDNLKLVYNKARQASITQELSEIVAGAAAV
ncbi:MAG: F0F1 ATP synthase subunit gamma [Gammaproteobacteria bacterium]|nr:F0F1 ATP synthase subunit gamma [Gammaproteobacteria bacterium]